MKSIAVVIIMMNLVAMWKIFEKAGVAGWKALIPVYNIYLLCFVVMVK